MNQYNIIGKVIGQQKETLHLTLPFVPRVKEVIILNKRVFRVDEVIYNADIPSVILWIYEPNNDRVSATT